MSVGRVGLGWAGHLQDIYDISESETGDQNQPECLLSQNGDEIRSGGHGDEEDD